MVPNLRFPQFTEPWNNYMVSELLNTYPTNSLSWDQLSYNQDSSLKNLHYGLIHNGFQMTCITGEDRLFPYINQSLIPVKYTLIQNGDLILADASEDRKDVGRPVEMLDIGNQKIVSGLHTIHARNKTNLIANGFKGFYFQSSAMKQQIFKIANGSKIYGISSSTFNGLKMRIPEKQEQKKIVDLMITIEERIQTQSKIIDTLLSEMNSIRSLIFNKSSLKWIPLKDIVAEQDIKLKRGKVIPKHKKNLKYIYPVYSSSITNSGLMGYSDSYMFNQELITWSIDGGGNFFYRKKHKFNITNVSGYMILNENLFNYQFIVQSLIWQHEKLKFDYQTKAHPSVVESLYKIPIMDLEEQHKYACLFSNLNEKYELELHILDLLNMQKKYLLKNMFV